MQEKKMWGVGGMLTSRVRNGNGNMKLKVLEHKTANRNSDQKLPEAGFCRTLQSVPLVLYGFAPFVVLLVLPKTQVH